MGAWGFGALESDGALDWLGDHVQLTLENEIARAVRDRWPEDARAATQVVISLPFIYWNEDILCELHVRMLELRDDAEWINEWTEPDEIRSALTAEVEKLEGAIANLKPPANA